MASFGILKVWSEMNKDYVKRTKEDKSSRLPQTLAFPRQAGKTFVVLFFLQSLPHSLRTCM